MPLCHPLLIRHCRCEHCAPRPILLPHTSQQDDYVVFETMGAYSLALRTTFNGFYPNDWAFIDGE